MKPGLLTTVQDLGRWGYQSLGVPVAGAMDAFSHRVANLLVGNQPSAATLEVTLTGPELVFTDERTVAVSGAVFMLTVDGRAVPGDDAFMVAKDAVLRFGARVSGARAYVAIAGGIDVPTVLGSRSTYLPARMGGHGGRALTAGDQVPLGPPSARRLPRLAGDVNARVKRRIKTTGSQAGGCVRVLAGPQDDRFAATALAVLAGQPYEILPASGRMGYRLAGPTIHHLHSAEIISDATPAGTLQVPPSGQPILLMADRQTTGGYAKLATVISADLAIVAQAAPGDALTFAVCSQAEALAALIAQERALLALGADS